MSATTSRELDRTIERCRPEDVTPVRLHADALETTAPGYLGELKRELVDAELVPARLVVEASFDADCSLRTQEEADRIRGYVRAASFLGVNAVTVEVETVAAPDKARPALAACAERARREAVGFDLDAPVSLEG